MNKFFETKRKSNWINVFFPLTLSLVLIAGLLVQGNSASADASIDTQRSALEQKLSNLNDQISGLQNSLASTNKQATTLQGAINQYDTQIQSTQLQIQANQTQIDDTNLQIADIQNQITIQQQQIASNQKILAQLIVQYYQLSGNSFLQMSLGTTNFSDFLNQVQYTEDVQGKVYDLVQRIKAIEATLQQQEQTLQIQLTNLNQLKDQLQQTQGALSDQVSAKQRLLAQTKNSQKNYQKLLASSNSQVADIQKEINDLNALAQGNHTGPGVIPSKGVLGWPTNCTRISQGYGNTGFTALGYSFHNGIDIACAAGSPIYAAADGTVVGVDTGTQAYGNWCALKNAITTKGGVQQIVTLYGHMRVDSCTMGKYFSKGDIIGYEGNTGNTTRLICGDGCGYHLHFTVFDANGFRVSQGKYQSVYGHYSVPFGFTYNPMGFL